jgi:single-stranded DNA-specific DHH superfamily exonuclease
MRYHIKDKFNIKYHTFQGVMNVMPMIMHYFATTKEEVIAYYDPDIDGAVAGTMAYRAIQLALPRNKPICYINENRAHGFKMNYAPDTKQINVYNKNFICVDFGITAEEMQKLTAQGNTVLAFDHHECQDELILYDNGVKLDYNAIKNDKQAIKSLCKKGVGILINNQYPFEPKTSRYLSGAGVTYEAFLQYFRKFRPKLVPGWETKEQRGLVGWSLLSDVRDIENESARGYLQELYTYEKDCGEYYGTDILTGLLNILEAIRTEYDIYNNGPVLDRTAMDFKLSPLFNSHFRFNKGYDIIEYLKTTDIHCLDLNMHAAQKALTSKIETYLATEVEDGVSYFDFDNLLIFAVDADSGYFDSKETDVLSSFVGLVCNKRRVTKSIIGAVITNGEVKRASFRGHYTGVEYRKALNDAHLLVGAGHGAAFGILEISLDNYEDLQKMDAICGKLDKEFEQSSHNSLGTIIDVENFMSLKEGRGKFKALPQDGGNSSIIYRYAWENMFHLDESRIRLRYTGRPGNVEGTWNYSGTLCNYSVNGVRVKCFMYPLAPAVSEAKKDVYKRGLICPVLQNGVIMYHLDKEDSEQPY